MFSCISPFSAYFPHYIVVEKGPQEKLSHLGQGCFGLHVKRGLYFELSVPNCNHYIIYTILFVLQD